MVERMRQMKGSETWGIGGTRGRQAYSERKVWKAEGMKRVKGCC